PSSGSFTSTPVPGRVVKLVAPAPAATASPTILQFPAVGRKALMSPSSSTCAGSVTACPHSGDATAEDDARRKAASDTTRAADGRDAVIRFTSGGGGSESVVELDVLAAPRPLRRPARGGIGPEGIRGRKAQREKADGAEVETPGRDVPLADPGLRAVDADAQPAVCKI